MNLNQHRKVITALTAGLISITLTASASAAVTHDVTVGPGGAFIFTPASLTIEVGDTVNWIWDSGGHNVGSGLPGAPTPFFLSGAPDVAGTTFSVLFDQNFLDTNPVTGNLYDYHCHPHGGFGMVGSINVIPTPGAASLGLLGLATIASRRRRSRATTRRFGASCRVAW